MGLSHGTYDSCIRRWIAEASPLSSLWPTGARHSLHIKDSEWSLAPVLALMGVPGGQGLDTQINAGFMIGLSQKTGGHGDPNEGRIKHTWEEEGRIPRGGKSIGKS